MMSSPKDSAEFSNFRDFVRRVVNVSGADVKWMALASGGFFIAYTSSWDSKCIKLF
jgi:hypothetical protein